MIIFQNCGRVEGGFDLLHYGSASMSSSTLLDTDHPPSVKPTQSVQKMQIANRRYVAHLIREIFSSKVYPHPNLESLIDKWVLNRNAQFGLGCDPYSTYSGKDCGGDVSAANLPPTIDDNTIRQSYRIQLCDSILSHDNAVHSALEKMKTDSAVPDEASIGRVYRLFYRGEGATKETIDALVTMDSELAESGESPLDRWRALILQVCISPGWQLL